MGLLVVVMGIVEKNSGTRSPDDTSTRMCLTKADRLSERFFPEGGGNMDLSCRGDTDEELGLGARPTAWREILKGFQPVARSIG
jgi:hypothetical protein